MVEYYQHKFFPILTSFKKCIVIFLRNILQIKAFKLVKEEKFLILIIYDNNIFNINDGKKKI